MHKATRIENFLKPRINRIENRQYLTNFEKGYNEFLNILTNGYGRMPAWGGRSKLTNLQLDELASYLRHISTEKSKWN